MFAVLKDIGVRKSTAEEVIARIRRKTAGLPGAQLFLTPSQDIRVGGRMSNAAYQFTLQSQDLDALKYWAPIVLDHLKKIPIIVDVNSDQQDNGLQSSVVVDRDTASRLGLTAVADRCGALRCFRTGAGLHHVYAVESVSRGHGGRAEILAVSGHPEARVHPQFQRQAVPLSAFAHFLPGNTPLAIAHQGVFPSVTISFSLPEGVSLGQAVDAINDSRIGNGPAASPSSENLPAPRRPSRIRSRTSRSWSRRL